MTLQVAHTSGIAPAVLAEARDLLDVVFPGEMTDDDWEHSLGGMHVLARCEGRVIGHASLIQRRIVHGGVALRTGYIEGVGVHPDCQRRGIGGQMMDTLEKMIAAAYDIGALGASDAGVPFYEQRHWVKWLGPTSAMTPEGIVRTADEDGWIYVLPGSHSLDIHGELTCDWRGGDVW